jgi:hypothetical protein
MCDKCDELDKKIERYWKLSAAISDRLALDGIKAAIEDLQTQKAALHLSRSRKGLYENEACSLGGRLLGRLESGRRQPFSDVRSGL